MSQLYTGSKLLNKSENDILISLLPRGSTIQVAGVVDLSTTQEPDHSEWFEIGAGVVGFVRDATRRSYYIQFFNIVDRTITWEQEVYNDFKFQILSPCQMVFEGENSMISMAFSDEIECKGFCTMLANKVAERKARHQQLAKGKSKVQNPTISAPSAPAIKEEPESASKPKKFTFESGFQALKKSYMKTADKLSNKKSRTSKLVIGEPEGFRHLNHIGFDPQKGFDLNKCDAGWKKLFSSLGINEAILTDTKKSNFIFEFVEKNGGIDKLLNEIDVLEKENKPIPNINNQAQQPPPVASRARRKKPHVEEPDSDRGPPPPPPPASSKYKADDNEADDAPALPPPKQNSRKPRQKAMPPLDSESPSSEFSRSSDSMPPPPPPPPPAKFVESAPAMPNRPPETKKPPLQPPRPTESASSDPRDALLAAISKGANLKAASEREITQIQSSEPATLVESLATSLAKMRAVTAGDDDSDLNSEENEDEWST